MQAIYNYISETNHVSRVYSVAAVLYLQFVLHVTLFRPICFVLLNHVIIVIIIIIITQSGSYINKKTLCELQVTTTNRNKVN